MKHYKSLIDPIIDPITKLERTFNSSSALAFYCERYMMSDYTYAMSVEPLATPADLVPLYTYLMSMEPLPTLSGSRPAQIQWSTVMRCHLSRWLQGGRRGGISKHS